AVRPRVLDPVREGRVAEEPTEKRHVAAQAQVDDLGTVVDDVMDTGVDVVDRPVPVAVEHLGDDELAARSDTRYPDAVVGSSRRTADVGAVALVVPAPASLHPPTQLPKATTFPARSSWPA